MKKSNFLLVVDTFFSHTGCIQFGRGITGFEDMKAQNEIDNIDDCQVLCKKNPPCKIFYWNNDSQKCYTANHLYLGENQIVSDANSTIGLSNCSNNSQAILQSIFITRPTENSTGFIVGAVVALLLIGGFASLSFIKRKPKKAAKTVGKEFTLPEQLSNGGRISKEAKTSHPGKL